MFGDPPSIRAFKTLITPEHVKFFEDSDSLSLISLSFESDILREFFPVSFLAATDEGTPQKFSPQDTPTKSTLNFFYGLLSCLNRYVSVGNCKLLPGRSSLFRQRTPREVYNLDYVTE